MDKIAYDPLKNVPGKKRNGTFCPECQKEET